MSFLQLNRLSGRCQKQQVSNHETDKMPTKSLGFLLLVGGEHVLCSCFYGGQKGGFEEKLKGGFKGSFRGVKGRLKGGWRGGFKG